MAIHVALNHRTHYAYDRPVGHSPHVIRLRPAPHTRTPILSYHVSHPGGLSYDAFRVNAWEAESRRLSRFFPAGHTPGTRPVPEEEPNPSFPFTLDSRRNG